MRNLACVTAAAVCILASGCAGEKTTLTGVISDALCAGAGHMWDEHSPVTEHECTLACVRAGRKYVFVSNQMIYAIQNQDDPQLSNNAGDVVQMIGRLKDNAIRVEHVELLRP